MSQSNNDIALFAINEAKKLGATEADAVIIESEDTTLTTRLKEFENIERSETKDLGIRVLVSDSSAGNSSKGYKTAIISTNNLLPDNIKTTVEKAISIAKLSQADEHIKLADENQLAKNIDSLELFDNSDATPEELKDWAIEVESAALEVDKITNSEGAAAGVSKSEITLVTSKGFAQSYKTSGFTYSVSVIAADDNGMETDYDYSYKRFKSDLDNPTIIGKNAGELTAQKLSPRKIKSCKVPIIFDKRVSKGLLSSLCSAVNGAAINKDASFLRDSMGEQILPKNINIIDDPKILRGLSSNPFDAEGMNAEKMHLVENGILKNWLLDLRSASKLNMQTNGRATRGISSGCSPSSTNVYMQNGDISVADILKDIKEGFYLTEAFGMGVNNVTGDYSQGAGGFWIENGELTYAISEITIAGNLKDMFKNLIAANDLEMRYSKNAPTILIEGMTVAGS